VSPDGYWAIAWTDARLVPSTPATEGFHDVSIIDLQAASGDAGLSQSLSGLARHVSTLRTDVNAISGLVSSYTGICTIDAAGPSGVSSYAVHCKG